MKKASAIMVISLVCFAMITVATQAKNDVTSPQAYLTNFLQLTTNSDADRAPAYSPDGTGIAYYAFVGTWNRYIWVMNADGSDKKQLTFGSVVDEKPDYSPDGTKIVFMRYGLRGGIFDLMTMNADGTNIQQLTSTGLSHHKPEWSHDGQKLAFLAVDDTGATTRNEIHMMNADGTNEITLVSIPYGLTSYASWSPDDTKIAYANNDGIWVVNTSPPYDSTHLFTTNVPVNDVCFSSDGEYILYTLSSTVGQPQGNLYLIAASGDFVAQLTSDNAITMGPFDWSPDRRYIVFGSTKSGNEDIWRAEIIISVPEAPLSLQWWLWTNMALATTTGLFAVTTVYYRRRATMSKEPKANLSKMQSKEYKICPNCGANLPTDSKYCGKCGTSL